MWSLHVFLHLSELLAGAGERQDGNEVLGSLFDGEKLREGFYLPGEGELHADLKKNPWAFPNDPKKEVMF